MTAKQLLKHARKLDTDGRTVLAHDILKTVEADNDRNGDIELSPELKQKLDARLEEAMKDPYAGYTWTEVKRKLARRRNARRKKHAL